MTGSRATMETRFEVETSLGPVWFWGRDTWRPILLLITGAFADASLFWKMQDYFPDADVLRAHLPGNHCPQLAEVSISAYAAAYTEALSQRWPDRPLIAFGVSAGGLVALGLRAPALRRLVVIEPPLLTEGVWPLSFFRSQTPPGGEAFVWNIFGVGPDRIEPRDHGHVLQGLAVPTLALVGDDTLNAPRHFETMPSLMSPASLALLRDHPLVTVETASGAGHHIPRQAAAQTHGAVVRTWNAAFPAAGEPANA